MVNGKCDRHLTVTFINPSPIHIGYIYIVYREKRALNYRDRASNFGYTVPS